ncbi:MAG: hypothetical protein KDI79_31995 [Anaerolineae bacterium]|nr:hypothetical protein [Anaerolineae bacterium]
MTELLEMMEGWIKISFQRFQPSRNLATTVYDVIQPSRNLAMTISGIFSRREIWRRPFPAFLAVAISGDDRL